MNYIPDIYSKRVLILGCGNVLFGDDGFGPEVCKYLTENHQIPEDVGVEDCGTGVREILFDIRLSSQKIVEIIIVDAIDSGRRPGEIFEMNPDDLSPAKSDDFLIHALPTSNLLKELRDKCGIKVSILACQISHIPPQVKMGLSLPLKDGVKKAAQILAEKNFIIPSYIQNDTKLHSN
ncbi:hydrogenase maturation protease [bacterium]|nr:hydrogenase maturation protease [bacterium]